MVAAGRAAQICVATDGTAEHDALNSYDDEGDGADGFQRCFIVGDCRVSPGARLAMTAMATKDVGNFGERLAQSYLEQRGYTTIAVNWWCKAGEIDLIMQDGQVRVFVEVRLRRPTSYGAGLETVAWQKQQKLIRAAQWYQQQERYWEDVRFDVVSIMHEEGMEPEIEHIEYAFEA